MFGLLLKFFSTFFVGRAFHACFTHLIDMAAFIVSNAALIEIKICEILHFVSKKEVFCNCGK